MEDEVSSLVLALVGSLAAVHQIYSPGGLSMIKWLRNLFAVKDDCIALNVMVEEERQDGTVRTLPLFRVMEDDKLYLGGTYQMEQDEMPISIEFHKLRTTGGSITIRIKTVKEQ